MLTSNFNFYDGNGNAYYISENTINYDPISPMESSSGIYSGGTAKEVVITKDQFDIINRLAENAVYQEIEHARERLKGTYFLVHQGKNITLKRTSETAVQLLKTLQLYLKG